MGGPGSGRYPTLQAPALDSMPRLSIDHITRLSKLKPGWIGEVDLYPVGSVTVLIAEDNITISYYISSGRRLSHTLELEKNPCQFGGHRGAVKCLMCTERNFGCISAARTLFVSSQGPICRRCMGLPYRSQKGDPLASLYMKLNRLRFSLGCAPGAGPLLPNRPKGMHSRVYQEIIQDIKKVESQIAEILSVRETRFTLAISKLASKV